MKRGKACDIYYLTTEHLQYCGDRAKDCILKLLKCSQTKADVVFIKGKENRNTSQNRIAGLRSLHK